MANEVGGLLDGFLKVSFDHKKFLASARVRQGIELIAAELKEDIQSPINIDDKLIDGMVASLEALLDSLKNAGPHPLVVGAKVYTKADADAFIASLGASIPASCTAKLQQYPQILEALEKLSPEKKRKAAESDTVLDRLINILITWGPIFLKFAMMILPFLL